MKLLYSVLISIFMLLLFSLIIAALKIGRKEVRIPFIFYMGGLALWKVTALFIILDPDLSRSVFYYYFGFVGTSANLAFFLPLALSLSPLRSKPIFSVKTIFLFTLSVFLFFSFIHGFFLDSIVLSMGRSGFYVPDVNVPIVLIMMPSLILWFAAVAILAVGFRRHSSRIDRNRKLYLFIGALLIFIGMALNLTLLQDYPVDLLLQGFSIVIIAYGLLKYPPLDIRLLFFKIFFRLLQVSLAVLGFLGLHIVFSLLLPENIQYLPEVASFFIIFYITIWFDRKKEESRLLPFSRKRRYTDFAHQLSLDAINIDNTAEAVDHLISFFTHTYKTKQVYIALRETQSSHFGLYSPVFPAEQKANRGVINLSENHPSLRIIEKLNKPVLYDSYYRTQEGFEPFSFTETETLDTCLVAPIFSEVRLKGFIIVSMEKTVYVPDQVELVYFAMFSSVAGALILRTEVLKDLEQRIAEKELLLREIHHRVKNNMQVVGSILNLTANKIKDKEILVAIKDCQTRIYSMAHVHEHLCRASSLAEIHLDEYLRNLSKYICDQYKESEGILFRLASEPILLDIDRTIYLGMAVTELLMNAYKHAFAKGEKGFIELDIRLDKKRNICCTIRDNGRGIKTPLEPAGLPGIGNLVVKGLIETNLGGTWETVNDQGTKQILRFPLD